MQYWYSAQLRQYRLQFIRAFSGFTVKTGRGGPNNTEELIKVPCRYGDPSRIASSIVRGNSENKTLSVPFITCFVNSLNMNASRRQDPQLVEKLQVNERLYDEELGRYTNEIGNRYTVERHMPVPYDLTMQVDIWTNNLDIKEQLLEQIIVLYNPAIDVQTSVNPIDWTVLSYIEMQDNITWSSRSIPVGTENPIDVATFQFKLPIWINPPAKVKKQSLIHQIVTNIVQGEKNPRDMQWTEYEFFSRTITTPGNAVISVNPLSNGSYEILLCNESGSPIDQERLPTVTFSVENPALFTGMSFRWNDQVCNINSTNLIDVVNEIKSCLIGTSLNCTIYNDNSLQFINTSGGDNTFVDIIPGSLAALGLTAGTYPGGKLAWWRLLMRYGSLKPYALYGSNASQIRLKTIDDIDQTNTDIVGWIDLDPVDQNRIIWSPDHETYPITTIAPINAIVDPTVSGPNGNLPPATIGQRYLLTNDLPEASVSWGSSNGHSNDIIEFNGAIWQVSFDASTKQNEIDYVFNSRSNRLYKWDTDHWLPVINQTYRPGYWRLSI